MVPVLKERLHSRWSEVSLLHEPWGVDDIQGKPTQRKIFLMSHLSNKHCIMDCVPMLDSLPPSSPECDLSGDNGLYKGKQVTVRSLEWAPIQRDWCPYQKGKFGHRDRQKEGHR